MSLSRVALRLAYFGPTFGGFVRQPKCLTAEGALLEALARAADMSFKVESDAAEKLGYRVGSRTDKGVSVLANVVSVTGPGEPRRLAAWLGRAQEGLTKVGLPLWLTSWAHVGENFNPRHAVYRLYSYLLPAEGLDRELVEQGARLLVGEHDFAAFCQAEARLARLTLKAVEVVADGPWLELRFQARFFRYQMVRRLTRALELVGQGKVGPGELAAVLEDPAGARAGDWGAAPPEGLTLEAVEYEGLEWVEGPGRIVAVKWARQRRQRLAWELAFTQKIE